MNNLNILNTEVQTMTSKEICEVTGRQHNNTLKLIKSLIDKGLIHSGQFYLNEYTDSIGRKLPMYKLDEPASILVVARQSPEFTAALVKRWQELENQAVTQNSPSLPDFNDPVEAARAWADQTELAREQAELAREKTLELEAAAPKVAVYDTLMGREDDVKTTVLAKQLGTSAHALNKFLKDKGVKFKNDDLPMANYDSWFNVRPGVTSSGHEYYQCLVTPLGQAEITKLWNSYQNTMMSQQG